MSGELFECRFDGKWDRNYDGWPDHWRRQIDAAYPGYVGVEIEADATARSGHALFVRLQGGSAYFHTPAMPVSRRFSYILSVRARAEQVEHAQSHVGLIWQDAEGEPVGDPVLTSLVNASDWQEIRIGPISPANPRIRQAVVFTRVDRGQQIDLHGVVVVDQVRVVRLPQVVLEPLRPLGLFEEPSEVGVRCRVTGISIPQPRIRFELRSVEGELVDSEEQLMHMVDAAERAVASTTGQAKHAPEYQGEAVWRPGKIGYGFYRVHATLLSEQIPGEKRSTALAVMAPIPRPARGIFGWSLDSVTQPLSTYDWRNLVTQAGIHWVKFPIWYDASKNDLGDELVQFTERLAAFGIDVVGIVDRPPAVDEPSIQLTDAATIADVLSLDSSYWMPSLDPIMTRLSLRIRWWQFGRDHDTSLVGYPNLPELIESVRGQLYRFGQNVNVGVPWKWMTEPPSREAPPWQFIQWTADPPLTGDELAAYLQDRGEDGIQRWSLIDPLPRDQYSLNMRAADLIQQMMSARMHGAEAAFLPNPVDATRGVLDESGGPGELLLPFRTTAMLLGDAEYVGSMRLPAGSHNQVFRKPDGSFHMVVWSDRPATESLYLGDKIRQVDPWGREIPVAGDEKEQSITVSDIPSFVLDLNGPVAMICITAAFEQARIPSVFGKPHANVLTFTNTFGQGVGGTVVPVGSSSWKMAPDRLEFKAAAGATVRVPFEISPQFDASSGRQEVRLDFEIHAAEACRFSVWRHFDVGLGDIEIELTTTFDDDGTLVVEQRTLNNTDVPVDFKCLMYAPGRRRQRAHVFQLGRGQDLQYYRFPNGSDLIGEDLWLRAEEIGGSRVFNYHFRVER